jgi:hypothetical protein
MFFFFFCKPTKLKIGMKLIFQTFSWFRKIFNLTLFPAKGKKKITLLTSATEHLQMIKGSCFFLFDTEHSATKMRISK